MKVETHPIFRPSLTAQSGSDRFFLTTSDGGRAVVVQDSCIRWCNVSEPGYHSMTLERAFKDVKHVVMSKSGEFLCLYNDIELRIIEVPWAYTEVSSMANAFQLFRFVSDEARIKQVLFHPLAYQQETVVILKDDDSITIMNWQDFGDSKPDVLNLSNGTYSLDSSITDVESITFSQDGLTLYVLSVSEGADIYAFYPCLAPRMQFDKQGLDRLMYKSLIQYDVLNVGTDSEVKRNTIKQLKFVSGLHKQQNSQRIFEIPEAQRQVRGQGPFTIAPFPKQIYSSTGTGIASLPINDQNELLIMSLDDGNIAILLQDLDVTMNWDSARYNYNNSFALVELITLGSHEVQQTVVGDHKYGQFSAITPEGVFSIDTSKWSGVMASCLTESDLRPLAETKLESEVTFTELKGTPKSVAWWNTTPQSVVKVSNREVKSKQVSEGVSKQDDGITGSRQEPEKYNAHYSQPIAEIMQLNKKFQLESSKAPSKVIPPRERQKPLKNEASEIQLDLLTEASKDFVSKIAVGQTLGVTLHNRIYEQQLNLTHQLKASGELMEKQQTILTHLHSQSLRSDAVHARHSTLMSRFNKFKDNLGQIQNSQRFKDLEISKEEVEWFKEIRKQVLTFNRDVHNQKRLQDQLIHLKQEMNRIAQATGDQNSQARDEWHELRHMLEEDTLILQDCNNQLKSASRQVPAQP